MKEKKNKEMMITDETRLEISFQDDELEYIFKGFCFFSDTIFLHITGR